jgi:hypothetical protein
LINEYLFCYISCNLGFITNKFKKGNHEMKKAVLILCVFSLLSFAWLDNTSAAPPQYYNYNTTGATNQFPFNMSSGKKVQLLYLPGDFNQPSAAPSGTITSVAFRIHDSYPLGPWTYSNFTIRMGQSSITSFTSGAFYGGSLTTVYTRSSVTLQGTAGDWMTITLDSPFTYDPTQSLIVDVEQTGVPGAWGYSACFTTGAGNRRIWSVGGSPFIYSSVNDAIYHFGINLTPSSTTTTTVNCTPDPVAINHGTTCTATVTDTALSGATAPTGTVTFSTDSSGGFTPANTCTLGSPTSNSSSCSVTYTPTSESTHIISGSYSGSTAHASSSTTTETDFDLTVNPISVPTINQWGMIIFMIFAGLVAGYYLRKYRRTES